MAKNDTSIFVRAEPSKNILENEALRGGAKGAAEGAVKWGAVAGLAAGAIATPLALVGVAPAAVALSVGGAAAAIGGTLGGIGGVVEGGKKEHQKGTIGKEVEAPTFWNGELFATAAAVTVTGVATGGLGFMPAVAAIGGTILAGKMGEKRMENEYREAKQQAGAEMAIAANSAAAMNLVAARQNQPMETPMVQQANGMYTLSPEDSARLQAAQQNRGVHGKFTAAALQGDQQQQLGMAGAVGR